MKGRTRDNGMKVSWTEAQLNSRPSKRQSRVLPGWAWCRFVLPKYFLSYNDILDRNGIYLSCLWLSSYSMRKVFFPTDFILFVRGLHKIKPGRTGLTMYTLHIQLVMRASIIRIFSTYSYISRSWNLKWKQQIKSEAESPPSGRVLVVKTRKLSTWS